MSMTDITERLRALVILDEVGSDNPLGRDAADEIERLRMDVTRSVEAMERIGKQSPAHRELVRAVWNEVVLSTSKSDAALTDNTTKQTGDR